MSRDESDLRAALHAGEGDGVDADRVIGQALAVRHARRTRWASVAASVVVVAAVGSGIGALAHFGRAGDGGRASGSAGSVAADSGAGANSGALGGAVAAPEAAPDTTGTATGDAYAAGTCPPTPPAVRAPESGTPGTSGRLVDGRITSVTVCGFRAERAGGSPVFVRGSVFTGDRARRLVDSLDSAPTRPAGGECHSGPPGARSTVLVFYAITRSGPEPPTVVDQTCDLPATNGTAVRYDWTPPADLAAKLDALTQP